MVKTNMQEKSLSPAEYKELLSHVSLYSINMESCSSQIRRNFLDKSFLPDKSLKINIEDKTKYDLTDENTVIFTHNFLLVGTKKNKKDFGLKIECSFAVKFTSEVSLSTDFLDIYGKFNLHLNTWPYFREFVQSITSRMGIPPLTMPLLKQ